MNNPFALSSVAIELPFVLTSVEQTLAFDASFVGSVLIQDIAIQEVFHKIFVRLLQTGHKIVVVSDCLLTFQQPHNSLVG